MLVAEKILTGSIWSTLQHLGTSRSKGKEVIGNFVVILHSATALETARHVEWRKPMAFNDRGEVYCYHKLPQIGYRGLTERFGSQISR